MTFKVKFTQSSPSKLIAKKRVPHYIFEVLSRVVFILLCALMLQLALSVILLFLLSSANNTDFLPVRILYWSTFILSVGLLGRRYMADVWTFRSSITIDKSEGKLVKNGRVVIEKNSVERVFAQTGSQGGGRYERFYYDLKVETAKGEVIDIDRVKDYDSALYLGDAMADALCVPLHMGSIFW